MAEQFAFRNPKLVEEDLAVYDVRQKPFDLYGLYRPEEPGLFKRMPASVGENVSKRVKLLYTNTAGARIRFKTDSTIIAIGAVYPPMDFASAGTAARAPIGAFCFDMYVDGMYRQAMQPVKHGRCGSVVYFDLEDGHYESCATFGEQKLREITLNFPSFVNISEVYIGLKKDAQVLPGKPYVNEKPIVFYGSSITQGACASRPGNTYQNVLSRRLNFDYINLGFAGSCKAEDIIVDYVGTLDMSVMVFDYDHNASNPKQLKNTHLRALRRLRAALPNIPFVLMTRPDEDRGEEDTLQRLEIVKESYEALLKDGCGPVHLVDGHAIYHSHDTEMMTIDGTHPTDLGFYCMAEALEPVLAQYMK